MLKTGAKLCLCHRPQRMRPRDSLLPLQVIEGPTRTDSGGALPIT
jgi:hypothetical protein